MGPRLDLDAAIYTEDLLTRDAARRRLSETADSGVIAALITLLDAPHKLTRRRAARVLGDMRAERVGPALAQALGDTTAPVRRRVAAARLLTVVRPDGAPTLADGLRDPEPRVRRACATAAAPPEALIAALADTELEVVERAAAALAARRQAVPIAALRAAAHAPSARRLLACLAPADPALAARPTDAVALDYLEDVDALRSLLDGPHRIAAVWALCRIGACDPGWAADPDARVRSAAARAGLVDDDTDPAVAWLARRAAAGAFEPARLEARVGPHDRQGAVSAQAPYGIQPDDLVPEIARAPAALALCQPRFDINLGVAVRSAEGAGLREVFLVGQSGLFRSPARGTDRVIPVHPVADAAALIRHAREAGYQIVAVQQTPDSVPYHTADYPPRPLFVMGAENHGVPPRLRRAADLVVEIPLFGVIDSLNVAAAATTVLFHWRCSTATP